MQSDHFHFRDNLSVDKTEPEVESVVRLLATKLAATVEALIRQVSLHGNTSDPTGSITGWFAYKLFFTVQHQAYSRTFPLRAQNTQPSFE